MKKNLTYLIIIIALIIPSLIAVKSYFDAQNAPASTKNALSVQIDDINGNTYLLKKDDNAEDMDSMLNYFLGLNSKATKILTLPDSVSGQKCFRVTISTAIKDEVYQYFMSTTPSLCYMVDPSGAAYQLAESDAAAFLDSKYSESLYPAATRPTLTISNEFSASPVSSVWKYKTYSANYVTADTSGSIATKDQHFDINGGLSVGFDIVPDHCTVKLIDSTGLTIFDDSADNLSNLRIEEETNVSVEILAKWYEEASRDYFGENSYKFTATLTAPASFYVLKTTVAHGEFITISAKRAADISKIGYKCEPDLGVTPKFFSEGDYAHALLPVPHTTEAGDYKITLTYGSTVQDVTLTVEANPRSDAEIEVTADVLAASYTEEALSEFDALVDELTASTGDKRLFDGYFLSYPGGAQLARGYGRKIILNGDPNASFTNYGVDYIIVEGSPVPALNTGTVAYAGSTGFTGNIVVIDHGMGLKTWYWGLDSVSVAEGAAVTRGDEIGSAGTSGLTDGRSGFHIAMSIGDVFVSPYDAWESSQGGDNGILMQGVLEPETSAE